MQWQLNSDGTGYEITSGEDYYEPWIDTTEISWDSIDDSLHISLFDEEEDSYEESIFYIQYIMIHCF